MKPVIQQHPSGCAIACAATLAACSYLEARDIAAHLGIVASDKKLWSTTKPLRLLLQHWSIRTGDKTAFVNWDSLPDCALLAIKWREINGTPFWHWVVFYRDQENPKGVVLDPKQSLKKNTRCDFGRIKPKWFMAVETPSKDSYACPDK